MNLTDWTALFGAVGSTVAVTWNVLRELRDRKQLRVEIKLGYFISSTVATNFGFFTLGEETPIPKDKKILLILSVVNVGKQPINIRSWGGQLKNPIRNSTIFFMTPSIESTIPKLLHESEIVIEYSNDLSKMDMIKTFWVCDSSDKHWKLSKRNFKRLMRVWENVKNETLKV